MVSWIILFIAPMHFVILFLLLGSFNVQFNMTTRGISNVFLISLSSFFDFGYFRIYEAFIHRYPGSFFADEERIRIELSGKILPVFGLISFPELCMYFYQL
jgi:hypothetical protein